MNKKAYTPNLFSIKNQLNHFNQNNFLSFIRKPPKFINFIKNLQNFLNFIKNPPKFFFFLLQKRKYKHSAHPQRGFTPHNDMIQRNDLVILKNSEFSFLFTVTGPPRSANNKQRCKTKKKRTRERGE